jgi:hypothetical protein
MELVQLVMTEAGPFGVLVGVLWLFRNHVRFSFNFGKSIKE